MNAVNVFQKEIEELIYTESINRWIGLVLLHKNFLNHSPFLSKEGFCLMFDYS